MKKLALTLTLAAALAAGTGFALPGAARAQGSQGDLDHINVTYHGGPLLQQVKVVTIFWGSEWQQDPLHDTFNSFFQALFADGRYLGNLAQYSTNNYQIGNGQFGGTATAKAAIPATVTDAQIQALIRSGIERGAVPPPDPYTLYFVAVPGSVQLLDPSGTSSEGNFDAYHFYDRSDGFAYAVVIAQNAQQMTKAASHELAEAVTDPEVDQDTTIGWYDDNNGEIGDIPNSLYDANRIGLEDLLDTLVGSDGTQYTVQKVWSNQDSAPVAFAQGAN